ncbi:MAG TPA: GntR family transcriptional regulator [Oscillospiraceae bacterium]|nr:GntR family transcriptional regulator [Oscillospiraceae bacterium]
MEITNGKTYRTIIEQIQDSILRGELKCGDRLPPERTLSEQLQVSRASVREAIKVLEMMGLVESRQGDGTFIVNRAESSAVSALALAFTLEKGSVTDLLQMRRCIEMEACRNIIASGDALENKISRLDAFLATYDASAPPPVRSDFDIGFHSLLVRLSDNLLFAYISNALAHLMRPYVESITVITDERYAPGTTPTQHRMLVDALRRRDISAAEGVLSQHFLLEDQDFQLLGRYTHWGLRAH